MGSGRTETPMPADMLLSQVVDVGYCPTCRYRLTAHDFGCDAIGRLVLQHQCRGSAVVPCQYVPSGYEESGHSGYEVRLAKGCYKRTPPKPCKCGCGEPAASRKAFYAKGCAARIRKERATAMRAEWREEQAAVGQFSTL